MSLTPEQQKAVDKAFYKEIWEKRHTYLEIKCKDDYIIKELEIKYRTRAPHEKRDKPYCIVHRNEISGKQYLFAAYNGVCKRVKEPFQYMPDVAKQEPDGKTSKIVLFDSMLEWESMTNYINNTYNELYNIKETWDEIKTPDTAPHKLIHTTITLNRKRVSE